MLCIFFPRRIYAQVVVAIVVHTPIVASTMYGRGIFNAHSNPPITAPVNPATAYVNGTASFL